MRRTPILRFRASLAPRAKAPLIDIKAATFYRHLPSVEPSDEERLSNPPLFPGLDFSFPSENVSTQYWAISGPSNAGKTTFLEVLRGHHLCFPPTARKYPYLSSAEIEAKDHRLRYPGHAIQYVGFDTKERGLSGMGTYLSARYESRREATDFSVLDYLKGNTQLNALPVEEAIDSGLFDRVVEDMRLGPLLDMPFTNLSNGQTRRTRIAKALLGKPELLLLDEPFMGLDPPTMRTLSPILHRLASTDSPRLLLALRPQDPVPDWITHILYLGEDMKVTLQGPKDAVGQALIDEVTTFNEGRESAAKPPRFNTEFGRQLTRNGIVEHKKKAATLEDFEMALVKAQADWDAGNTSYAMKLELERLERMVTNPTKSKPQKALVDRAWLAEYTHIGEPVIEMEGVSVKYGDRPVLGNWEMRDSDSEEVRKGLWWTVHQGQRWGIFGPNGSGKTTLLSLILSDHPQSYSVPMKIFGRSRLPSPGQAGMSIFELQRRIGHSSPEVHGFFPRHLTVRQVLESAYADTPLARPTLSVEADARIDACLRWFQAELNPSIGMHYRLKQDLLRRGQRPSKDRVAMAGDPVRYKLVVETEEFELEQEMAASVEWADDLRFGEIPFSAQRVALFIRAIVAQPDIVILDEAFSGMDDYIRDKCLLFLDHGESKRLSLYSSSDHMVPNYENYIAITRPSSETLDYYVITEGLTDKQALLVVSHVREEVPASVRDWIFLPESETGAPCMIGKVKFKPLRADKLVWDMIWGLVPFEAEKRKTPKIRVREKKAAPVKKGRPELAASPRNDLHLAPPRTQRFSWCNFCLAWPDLELDAFVCLVSQLETFVKAVHFARQDPATSRLAPAAYQQMAARNGGASSAMGEQAAANKPKRVRTGCLTCRERHLKCDEALPVCMNCQKSSRVCKRGIRLNFIDTTCQSPPVIPETDEWHVDFFDESREIASEYRGGLGRYSAIDPNIMIPELDNNPGFEYAQVVPTAPSARHLSLPSIHGILPNDPPAEEPPSMNFFDQKDLGHQQGVDVYANATMMAQQAQYEVMQPPMHQQMQQQPMSHPMVQPTQQPMNPPEQQNETREIINSQEETLFMQVFVEEVGIWMDSMDTMKHFSRILPFHALGQPMLLNAFLACGVRHLTLVNTAVYQEEKALNYYDKASRYLLRALENPERDSVICATTAIILNVYEIMTEKALPRMNHIAGARALIKECGWSARSYGIGAACFWLNVGMELLSNLHFNWQPSWHPDTWGVDMNLSQELETGKEEIWTHRIVYITAKIGHLRATTPQAQSTPSQNDQIRREKRLQEWNHLKELADTWNNNIPRTMHPLAYLYPYQTTSRSAFPEIWLVKRTTIVARLFYHTAMCLMAQIHPAMSREVREMHDMEQTHAHQICGIVAHVKDRGVASVALRSLAIAAECLAVRREQDEILQILTKIHRETGWRIGSIAKELREKWGWGPDESPQLPTHANPHAHLYPNGSSAASTPIQRSTQYLGMHVQQQQQQQQGQYPDLQSSPLGALVAQPAPPPPPQQQQQATPPSAAPRKMPQGIVNPMFAIADFNMAKHPYQEYWVPPAHGGHMAAAQLPGLMGLGAMYNQAPPPPPPGSYY